MVQPFNPSGSFIQAYTVPVDPITGQPTSGASYQLATNLTLATTAAQPTPTTSIQGGSYIWNVAGATFNSSTLTLESLGSDGATWQTVASVTANGNVGIVLGSNSTVRLRNSAGANSITGIYSNLS